MDTENDPIFWEWLKELQDQNAHKKNTFERLVLELPLPSAPKKKPQQRRHEDPEINPSSPFSEYDVDIGDNVDTDDFVIYQF